MKPNFLLLILLSTSLMHSCKSGGASKDGDKAKNRPSFVNFAGLYTRYDAATTDLVAEAVFRYDTATEEIPEGVFFNGRKMGLQVVQELPRYRFVSQFKTCPPKYSFSFVDRDRAAREFGGKIPSIGEVTFPDNIKKSEPLSISWKGDPIAKGESLLMMFIDAENGSHGVQLVGPSKGTSATFLPPQLKDIALGKAEVYFVRKHESADTTDGIRTKSLVEYYSPVKTVTVK